MMISKVMMMRSVFLGAIALTLLSGGSAFEANSDIALDLQAGACTAFEVDNLPHKYSYDVQLVAMTGICEPRKIRFVPRPNTRGKVMGPRTGPLILTTRIC